MSYFASRSLAYFLDLIVILAITITFEFFLVGSYFMLTSDHASADIANLVQQKRFSVFNSFLHLIVYINYFTLSHWYFSKTIGKHLFGLKISEDLTLLRALSRSCIGLVCSNYRLLGIPFAIAYFTKEHKTIADFAARTRVVSTCPPTSVDAVIYELKSSNKESQKAA